MRGIKAKAIRRIIKLVSMPEEAKADTVQGHTIRDGFRHMQKTNARNFRKQYTTTPRKHRGAFLNLLTAVILQNEKRA